MIFYPDKIGEWHALARTAMEDVQRAEAHYYAQKHARERAEKKQRENDLKSMERFWEVISERHSSLQVIQDLVHRENPWIWNRLLNLPEE